MHDLQALAGAIGACMARAGVQLMRCQALYQPRYKQPTMQAASVARIEHRLPLALIRGRGRVLEGLRHNGA